MSGKCTLLIFMASLLGTAAAQQTPQDIRFVFTGDIMMSRQVRAEMHYRQDSPWREFSELFHGADLVGGNFESAIGDQTECPPDNSLCFASPESSAQTAQGGRLSLRHGREQSLWRFGKGGTPENPRGVSPERNARA